FGNAVNVSTANGHYELACDLFGNGFVPAPNSLMSIYYAETAATSKSRVIGGAGCQTVDQRATGWQFAEEGVSNQAPVTSTHSGAVVCGLDPINVNNTLGLKSVKVKVSDLTGHLSCSVHSYDRFGREQAHTATKRIPAAKIHQVIDFGTALTKSAKLGYYL